MMEEIYGLIPSSNSEDYSYYYSHDVASLKDGEEEYEAFVRSPWLSTTSSGASLSAAAAAVTTAAATISDHDDDPANTCNSIQKSGSSSLQEESTTSSAIKAKISSHPLYPKLLEAYINCQKIGAPPEMANLFDKVVQENDAARNTTVPYCFGEDPELDEFMETYCEMLAKYKLDLEKPYQEATTFLSNIESQLSDLCNKAATILGDEDGVSYNDDTSSGEIEEQQCDTSSEVSEIKDKLLRQYGGYISSLRHEFSKKKKNGKLPTKARDVLQHWWTIHYNWPYPTEADKIALAESTGLDQKQINNWFINQRKRHWKPSHDHNLKPILLSNLSGFFLPE